MIPATSTSMAPTVVLLPPCSTVVASWLPYLPPRTLSSSLLLHTGSWKSFHLRIRSSSTEDSPTIDASELLTDLKQKWDAVENKSTVLLYGGGAIVAVWLSLVFVGAIDSVPLLPKILELVGLGYTGWFVYRYLLFKSSRKELAEDIEGLKKKISGFE